MLLALALAALPLGCTADEKAPVPAAPPRSAPTPRAHLRSLKGAVQVKRATADDWSAASEDLPLFENDKVRTEVGAGD